MRKAILLVAVTMAMAAIMTVTAYAEDKAKTIQVPMMDTLNAFPPGQSGQAVCDTPAKRVSGMTVWDCVVSDNEGHSKRVRITIDDKGVVHAYNNQ